MTTLQLQTVHFTTQVKVGNQHQMRVSKDKNKGATIELIVEQRFVTVREHDMPRAVFVPLENVAWFEVIAPVAVDVATIEEKHNQVATKPTKGAKRV